MKRTFIILVLLVMASTVTSEEVDFSAANLQLNNGDTVVFDGVRVDGFGFSSKDDALKLKFKFDLDSLSFKLDTSDVVYYKGVGIFDGQCMVNDAPVTSVTTNEEEQEIESRQPFYTANTDATYRKNKENFTVVAGGLIEASKTNYTFAGSKEKPFIAEFDLQPNQVMSWHINRPGKTVAYQLIAPEIQNGEGVIEPGEVIASGELEKGDKLLLGPVRILRAGIYKLQMNIVSKDQSALFLLKVYNGNGGELKTLINNTHLRESFELNTASCSKFQVSLNRDEVLKVPAPGNKNVSIKLVNNRSKIISQTDSSNGDLVYKETDKNNDYYLFIYNKAGERANYGGRIKIVLDKPEGTEK
ncbi:hypothetical protein QUF50_00070 [Thiotrichales bacterium HSG1]|nr:hypothetical protein [Thiotrichales bacterium HSG1]